VVNASLQQLRFFFLQCSREKSGRRETKICATFHNKSTSRRKAEITWTPASSCSWGANSL